LESTMVIAHSSIEPALSLTPAAAARRAGH
jgi:hypothetical protein